MRVKQMDFKIYKNNKNTIIPKIKILKIYKDLLKITQT